MKYEFAGYPIAADDLYQVSAREQFALQAAEEQKALRDAFFVSHSDGRGIRRRRVQQKPGEHQRQ